MVLIYSPVEQLALLEDLQHLVRNVLLEAASGIRDGAGLAAGLAAGDAGPASGTSSSATMLAGEA